MEFAFTQEQVMIREMAASFLESLSPSSNVRQAMSKPEGYLQHDWQRICEEMCWQAIAIDEGYGGLGLGFVEQVIIMEEMGKKLLCSPYFSTVILAANCLQLCGDDNQKQVWLPKIAAGELTATLAWVSGDKLANRHWGLKSIHATCARQGDDYLISGHWQQVIDGHTCDLIILAAQDETSDEVRLFCVPADHPALTRHWTPSMDQTRKLSTVTANSLRLPSSALLSSSDASANLELVLALAQIALAAEQTGGAAQTMQAAIDYTQERKQFNRTIASFQAIKHRAANMKLELESAISALYYAACIADEWLAGELQDAELLRAASMAKAYCSDTFTQCANEAVQFHGGVGFTWEYDTHLYLKRAQSSEILLGAPALHRARVADSILTQAV